MKLLLSSFTAGELSPKLMGRSDLPGIVKGCRHMRNFLPRVTGGAFRRPGSRYAWAVDDQTKVSCLVPFNFSSEDSVVLELGHGVLRFGNDGALLGAPYELAAAWEEDEIFDYRFVQINDVMFFAHQARAPYILTRLSNTSWTLVDLHDLIEANDPANGFPWPAMMDENSSTTTIASSATTGTGVTLTASAATFDADHVGAFYQLAHRRDTAFNELSIPVLPPASNNLAISTVPTAGQTFNINGTVYTWKDSVATLSGPYTVFVGADLTASLTNATAAINGSTGAGTKYGVGTAQNPDVTAEFDETTGLTNTSATATLTSNGDNTLTTGDNIEVTIGSQVYRFEDGTMAAYDVRRGATILASLENLVKAINLTGTAATHYGTGTAINTNFTAALSGSNQIILTAKTAGIAGNALATTVDDPDHVVKPLSFGSATATGGGVSTGRITVTAREAGEEGNDITTTTHYEGVITGGAIPTDGSTVTIGATVYTFKTTLSTLPDVPFEVKINGGTDPALLNLIKAINLSGIAGTDYGVGTTAHPTVSAKTTVVATSLVYLYSDSHAGSGIALSVSAGTNATVSAATLQRQWSSDTLTGGTYAGSDTGPLTSDGLEILGDYKIWSYGTWKATVLLERETVVADTWEVIRQWQGHNDRNIVETGTAEYQQKLRFRVVDGVGTAASDEEVPRLVLEANDAKIYGLVRITAVGSSTSATADIVHELHSTDATTNWSEGAWSDYRGYPRAVAVHDQRLVFMGTTYQPQTMWFSATGDFYNYRRGVNDADAFSAQMAANESSPIVWGISIGTGMAIGKESQEWLAVSSDGQSPVTPLNFQAKPQSSYGSEPVQPVVVGSHILFAAAGGRSLMAFQYAWDQQAFFAVDLAELSDHLLRGRIKQMAFARKPDSVVWVVTHDGKLLSLSYRQEKEQTAWAYHPISGTVESVCAVNGGNGLDDVYIATKRTVNGVTVRYVECLHMDTMISVDEETVDTVATRSQLTYLDCSTYGYDATAKVTWTGLSHLENELVSVQADGAYHTPLRVSGGQITLSRAANYVLAGIDYSESSLLTPFKVDTPMRDGTAIGRKTQVTQLAVQLYNSSGAKHADTWTSTFYNMKLREVEDDINLPAPVVTKTVILACNPGFNDEIRNTIRPRGAEPLNVLSMAPTFSVSGN